jgi:hypothetical protein
MLIKLDGGTIAFLSLIASIAGVVVGLVSAVAAISAAFYAKRAATKGDLTRMAQKTEPLEHVSNKVLSIKAPIHPQQEQETPEAQAQRISISVEGEAMGEVPLELFLTLQDSLGRISRLERLGNAGNTLGSSPCKATDNALVFISILPPEKVRQWWDAGESTSEGEARSVARVYLLLDASGREVYRDVPVSIVEGLRNVGIATLVVWTIKGSI